MTDHKDAADREAFGVFLVALERYESGVRAHQQAIDQDVLKRGSTLEHQRWKEVYEKKTALTDAAINWKFHRWQAGKP